MFTFLQNMWKMHQVYIFLWPEVLFLQAVPCAAGHPEYRRAYNVIAKREAESDPTLYFVNPVGHRYGFPHNGFGQELIHSSNFGVCTNYLGQQVAC